MVGVVIIIAAIVIGAVLIFGGGSSTQTPQQATQAYYDALAKMDATTTWNLMTAETHKGMGSKSEWEAALKNAFGPGQHMVKVTADKSTINGNKATVEVTGTIDGKAKNKNVPLIKENGVWKIDIAGVAGQ